MAAGAVLVLILCAQVSAQGIQWRPGTLEEALAQARKDNKVVMVDVFADWCGPCKRLDREVFNQDKVARALEGAIAVKIDGEKGQGPSVVERYHVVGYPTVLFLDAQGQEIDRVFGFLPAADFQQTAADYLAGRRTLTDLQRALRASPEDNDLRYDVGRRLVIRGQLDEALKVFSPIFEKDRDNTVGFVPKIHFLLGKYAYLRGRKDPRKAVEHFQALLADHPDSPEAASAPYEMGRAFHQLGDPVKAMAAFEQWIALSPGAGRVNAVAWFCFQEKFEVERATAMARAALEKEPEAAFLWDTLAELLYAQGDAPGARQAIKKAIAADPDDDYYPKQLARFGRQVP